MRIAIVPVLVLILLGTLVAQAAGNDQAVADGAEPSGYKNGLLHIYSIGEIDPNAWKHLTDGQQKANVAGLKEFAEQGIAAAHLTMPLLVETAHFLVYSDAGSQAARAYSASLEDTYNRLATYFKLNALTKTSDQGPNVWRGKALLFLCRDQRRLETLMPILHPGESELFPLTLNGNGSVDMAASVGDAVTDRRWVCLAMAEGFLFRFRSPVQLDYWVSGGLSAAFGDSTPIDGQTNTLGRLRKPDGSKSPDGTAIDFLKKNDPDTIFTATGAIPVFDSLATYMVQHDRNRYQQFIIALKDGMKTEKALKEKYGMSEDELEKSYSDYLSRLQ